ncbi:hypothetical protein LC653_28070 [Nostoc sp. CHAB 5784]|uniref:hypothetical protein n=1 Tax=Nostoc mirabile TaxID=2907820 RepID=UPI001E5761D1|nr:hypothetical protein [Nostoc mirabile]MCC5667635.1 hypothetical protein [Nostoc mirabile CHAB5784]
MKLPQFQPTSILCFENKLKILLKHFKHAFQLSGNGNLAQIKGIKKTDIAAQVKFIAQIFGVVA